MAWTMGFTSRATSTDLGRLPLAVLVATLLVAGCGGGDTDGGGSGSSAGDPASPGAGLTTAAATTGSATPGETAAPAVAVDLAGTVPLLGTAPDRRLLRMSADPYCVETNKGGVRSHTLVTGGQGGLAGVFVYLSAGLDAGPYAVPGQPVLLDQRGCMYEPRVVGAQVGQEIEFRNSDPTLHNVHAMPKNSRSFNLGMPREDMSVRRRFVQAEVLVRGKCDVHPWMEAFVGVVDHPYFAVTDAQGRYTITGLPPGDYTLAAVHPRLGRLESVLKVVAADLAADGALTADFVFPAPAAGN